MFRLGLTTGTWGNASIYSRPHREVIITPSGMEYDCLTPDDLVVLDLAGRVMEGGRRPSLETPLHLAIYRQRKDVRAILHTHSVYATAAAVARTPLPAIVEELAQLTGGEVAVAAYAPAGSRELADQAVAGLGDKNAVLLANHGVVGVGPTIAQALQVCQVVERAACIFAYARLFGNPTVLSEQEIAETYKFYQTKYKQKTAKKDIGG